MFYMNFKMFLIVFVILSQMVVSNDLDLTKFHICTVASQTTPGLECLLDSCNKAGVEIDILGLGQPYKGNGKKLIYVKKYVSELPDDDIVLFVDGYDVLILADKETILRKFLSFEVPFFVSMEKNAYPYQHETFSPTPFKYINSGGYIGYVEFIKKMLSEIDIVENASDQGQLITYYLQNPQSFSFDYFSQIFLSLYMVTNNEVEIDVNAQIVRCLLTGTVPCVIHDNGRNYEGIYDKVCSMLFIKHP